MQFDYPVNSRTELLRVYKAQVADGVIGLLADEAECCKARFHEFFGAGSPKDGWGHIAREVRLLGLVCGGLERFGRSPSKTRDAALDAIASFKRSNRMLKELNDEPEFVFAAMKIRDQFEQDKDLERLQLMIEGLARVVEALDGKAVQKKASSIYSRRQRTKLAVLLTPLFECQFGAKATPVGGDRPLLNEDVNDWTRFFQMAASLVWGEQATPDRQRVLRAALWPND